MTNRLRPTVAPCERQPVLARINGSRPLVNMLTQFEHIAVDTIRIACNTTQVLLVKPSLRRLSTIITISPLLSVD